MHRKKPKVIISSPCEITRCFYDPWQLVNPPPNDDWRWGEYEYREDKSGRWQKAFGWYQPKGVAREIKRGILRRVKERSFDMAPLKPPDLNCISAIER